MRGGPSDASQRGYLNHTHGVVTGSDDSNPVQTLSVRLMADELATKVERFTNYGFHSVPPPSDDPNGKGVEVVVAFMGGNRSHPVAIADIDRRTKPKNWKPGDAGHWHYQGATGVFTQDGFTHYAGPDKKRHLVIVGKTSVHSADGAHTTTVGSTTVVKEDAKITTKTATKIFTGVVHLGAG